MSWNAAMESARQASIGAQCDGDGERALRWERAWRDEAAKIEHRPDDEYNHGEHCRVHHGQWRCVCGGAMTGSGLEGDWYHDGCENYGRWYRHRTTGEVRQGKPA